MLFFLASIFSCNENIEKNTSNKQNAEVDTAGDKPYDFEKIQNQELKEFLLAQKRFFKVEELSDSKAYTEIKENFFSFFNPQFISQPFIEGKSFDFNKEYHLDLKEYESEGYKAMGILNVEGVWFVILECFDDPSVYQYAFMLDTKTQEFNLGVPFHVDDIDYWADMVVLNDTIVINHVSHGTHSMDTTNFVNSKYEEQFLIASDSLVPVQ